LQGQPPHDTMNTDERKHDMKPKLFAPIKVMTAEQNFDLQKPRFDAFGVGHGVTASKKTYNRKQKHKNANRD